MPNNVRNILNICTDDIEKYLEIRNAIKGENGIIDFEKIIPMPEILNQTNRDHYAWIAASVIKNKTHGQYLTKIDKSRIAEFQSMNEEDKAKVHSCLDRYYVAGFFDWYDWRIANWGTKWNAYEISTGDNDEAIYNIEFKTAWSMPYEVYIALSNMFPDITFEVEYADEDWGYNCGRVVFLNGEGEYEFSGAGSKEDVKFACELWGYDYEEYINELDNDN